MGDMGGLQHPFYKGLYRVRMCWMGIGLKMFEYRTFRGSLDQQSAGRVAGWSACGLIADGRLASMSR